MGMTREGMKKTSIGGVKSGTRVLVTGAASGIGLTIAETFLNHGARVHICDVSPEAVESVRSAHTEIGTTIADVSSFEDVEDVFRDVIRSMGGLDVLVNNAGIPGPTLPLEDIEPDEWTRTIEVDLTGQFYCLRRAIPLLKSQGSGSIVNIVSNAGTFGCPLRAPYVASKWAMVGLTKTLAMELGPHNIRVNAIAPGCVEGPRIERVIEHEAETRGVGVEEVRQGYLRQISLGAFVSAQDIANMAVFICSDLGAKISGQILGVDGHTETLAPF